MVSVVHRSSFAGALLALFVASLGLTPEAMASDFWDDVKTPGLRGYRRHVTQARAAYADGHFEQAAAEADLAIARVEARPDAHVVKGRALGELGRTDEAATELARAIELAPDALDEQEAGSHAAQILCVAGRHDLAVRVLVRVLGRMSPGGLRGELYALLGDALLTLGPERLAEAVSAYREALRASGRHDVRAALGLALALRRQGELLESTDLARNAASHGRIDGVLRALPVPEAERAARRAVALDALGDVAGARSAYADSREGVLWRDFAERELSRLGTATPSPTPRPRSRPSPRPSTPPGELE
jgi:tetratricopeptide (TPR) repeat protein